MALRLWPWPLYITLDRGIPRDYPPRARRELVDSRVALLSLDRLMMLRDAVGQALADAKPLKGPDTPTTELERHGEVGELFEPDEWLIAGETFNMLMVALAETTSADAKRRRDPRLSTSS